MLRTPSRGAGGGWEAGRRCGRARRARELRYLWWHAACWGSVGRAMEEYQRARPAGWGESLAAGKFKLSERLYYPILEVRNIRGARGVGWAETPDNREDCTSSGPQTSVEHKCGSKRVVTTLTSCHHTGAVAVPAGMSQGLPHLMESLAKASALVVAEASGSCCATGATGGALFILATR